MLPTRHPDQHDLTVAPEAFNLDAERARFLADRDVMRLAAAVYDPAITHVGKWHRLTDSDLTALGLNPELTRHEASGFQAAIYGDATGEHHVVAMAGTDMTSLRDWATNLRQGLGLETDQYDRAVRLVEAAQAVFEENIKVTGHSLGGGLASAAAAANQVEATVFNPAGVHNRTFERSGLDARRARNRAATGKVRAYVVAGEILNAAQNFLPIPRAVGQQVVLPFPAPLNPAWRFIPGMSLAHRAAMHGMAAVTKAMDHYFREEFTGDLDQLLLDRDQQTPSVDLASINRYADYIEKQYHRAQEAFWSAGPELCALREEVVLRGRVNDRHPNEALHAFWAGDADPDLADRLRQAIAASPGADTKYGKLFRARRRFEEHTFAIEGRREEDALSLG